MPKRHDAIIIGTGQAGPSLAMRLAGAGVDTAIVERLRFGGTCVNTGCIPTKTLVASARAAYVARRAADYGVILQGSVRVDMQRVKKRKDDVVRGSNEGVEKMLREADHLTVYDGHARFESSNSIRVGDDVLTAEKIFLNVGGRAHIPPIPGADEVPLWTNSDMMNVDFLPEHLVVVGGGYVGLEFAQMYRRFGSRVSLIEMSDRLIRKEDEDVSDGVREILENEEIAIHLRSECIRFAPSGKGIRVGFDCDGEKDDLDASHVLIAVGRTPNTQDLGLDKAGVETDDHGYIVVNDRLETSVEGIWALGDVNGRGAFTHTAFNDYEVVASNLLDGADRKVTDRITTYGLFTDPPLGRVGMTEREARESGRSILLGKRDMKRIGRAKEKGETQGFMKILADADSKKILGAAILGVEGDEAVHAVTDAMYAGASYTAIQRAVHIHPTVAELIPTVLGSMKPLATEATSSTT